MHQQILTLFKQKYSATVLVFLKQTSIFVLSYLAYFVYIHTIYQTNGKAFKLITGNDQVLSHLYKFTMVVLFY